MMLDGVIGDDVRLWAISRICAGSSVARPLYPRASHGVASLLFAGHPDLARLGDDDLSFVLAPAMSAQD